MKSKVESKDLLVWQERPVHKETNSEKVVSLESYRQNQLSLTESTIVSWDLPSFNSNRPVSLIMVSSGFSISRKGIDTIQSMAA